MVGDDMPILGVDVLVLGDTFSGMKEFPFSGTTGMISSVNSDLRTNFRRRFKIRRLHDGRRTVYLPKASVGPGFFQLLSL
jgi:hypothetical protein